MTAARIITTIGTILLLAHVTAGCDSRAPETDELVAGSEVVNLGLDVLEQGVATYLGGDKDDGVAEIDRGMRMMDGGMEAIRMGVERFDGEEHPMMWGCDEIHGEMMRPMDEEMARMHEHHDSLLDGVDENDDEAVQELEHGIEAMRERMDSMETERHCRGHGGHG